MRISYGVRKADLVGGRCNLGVSGACNSRNFYLRPEVYFLRRAEELLYRIRLVWSEASQCQVVQKISLGSAYVHGTLASARATGCENG